MTEKKEQILNIFDTIREQRGMHCMWIDGSIHNAEQKKEATQDNIHDDHT